MFIFSPLEQFEINSLIPLRLGTIDISFTNSSLFILITCTLISLLFMSVIFDARLIPSRWQSFVEMLYEFILTLVNENIGPKGQRYFPLLFTLFVFILFANLIGMVPYSFTVTSHIIVTFGLALSMFVGITILGLITFRTHFFSLFFPQGAPLALSPLIVGIEIVSYLSRPVSLSIRLCVNMMAGHALLKIIAGFAWTMLSLEGLLALTGLIPMVILVALMGLEVGIACLQAYVFTVLLSIYINEALHLH